MSINIYQYIAKYFTLIYSYYYQMLKCLLTTNKFILQAVHLFKFCIFTT